MSFSRRALLGLAAGLPFALKAGACEGPTFKMDERMEFDDPGPVWLKIDDGAYILGADGSVQELRPGKRVRFISGTWSESRPPQDIA